jgi:hypothetical protein
MFIEQILHLVETGTIGGSELRDFVLANSYHGHHPSIGIDARHSKPFS